ncbi:hypothetical protein ACGFNU_21125 [Spirillospora sp. NPDC048911]|uniref:hypothetical protein n=1 Tax=Spirillospora sp. NPDC048911 TaxID=3364527 RepID=UPI003715A46E
MNQLVYSTDVRGRGWDAFDAMVLWAVSQRHTLSGIENILPAGISLHLIRKALDMAAAEGLLLRVIGDTVTYLLTDAGRRRINRGTETRRAA